MLSEADRGWGTGLAECYTETTLHPPAPTAGSPERSVMEKGSGRTWRVDLSNDSAVSSLSRAKKINPQMADQACCTVVQLGVRHTTGLVTGGPSGSIPTASDKNKWIPAGMKTGEIEKFATTPLLTPPATKLNSQILMRDLKGVKINDLLRFYTQFHFWRGSLITHTDKMWKNQGSER